MCTKIGRIVVTGTNETNRGSQIADQRIRGAGIDALTIG